MFILTLVLPSVLLSGFAFQAVEVERRMRLAERSSRLQSEARALVDQLDEVFEQPARRVLHEVAALGPLRDPRAAAPAITRLVASHPQLKSCFILDAQGRRVFPATPARARPLPWPHTTVGALGEMAGACQPPDPGELLAEAAELVTRDQDQALALLERAAELAAGGTRLSALIEQARLYEESPSLSGLLNARETYTTLARFPISAVDLEGRLAPALARFQLGFVAHAINHPDYRLRLEGLLGELDQEASSLPADALAQLAERVAAFLDDPGALRVARAIAARRRREEVRCQRLERLCGPMLEAAIRDVSSLLSGGRGLEGALDTETSFVKARDEDRYEILVFALLPGSRGPLGLVAVQLDLPALREELLRQALSRGASRLTAWDPEGSEVQRPELARQRLRSPFEHLAAEVRAQPEPPSAMEDALSLPRETVQLWAIALSIAGIAAGAFVTTRTVRRETKVAQLKSDFVSNVTHELKTPLTSIRMFLETLMLGRVTDEEEAQECLQVMNRETERLTRLIEQLLIFSRIEGRKWRVRATSEDPRDLVEDAIGVLADQLHESPEKLGIDVVAVQDLPPIPVDGFAVTEALLNLLHNAWKYSPAERRRIRVVITSRRREVEIAVEDNGMGVPRRDRRRIFVKFERAANAEKSRIEGSGIGLTLAHEIAKAHGGRIAYTALKPRGSRFALILPK